MNRLAVAALCSMVAACALLGGSYTSLDDVAWTDFRPYLSANRDGRLLDHYPFLEDAPVYHIKLDIRDDFEHIQASERVRFTNSSGGKLGSLDFVLLPNILRNTLTVIAVAIDGTEAPIELTDDGLRLRVTFSPPLSVGSSALITIGYEVEPPQSTAVGFGGLERADGQLSLAYAYPMIPASGRWEYGKPPAFGDLTANSAAFYLLEASYPTGFDLVYPGVELHHAKRAGRESSLIAIGPSRDLFLQLGKDLITEQRTNGGVEISVVDHVGAAASTEIILDTASYAMKLFSTLFGPYPYRGLTFVGARFDAYGLEFPGIILLTSRLFADPQGRIDGAPIRTVLESTVAHEVAHQWFYALLGNDQLAEPWIDEAFAQYATYRYYESRYGSQGAEGFLHALDGRLARVKNAVPPIGRPVSSYSPKEYSASIYGRGPLFLLAVAERMGADRFDRFLRILNDRYRWRTLTGADVKSAAESSCGCSLDDLWNEWVEDESTNRTAATADQQAF